MFCQKDIVYSYDIKCELCGKGLGKYIQLRSGYVHKPIISSGWNELNGKLYCDKHKITIE